MVPTSSSPTDRGHRAPAGEGDRLRVELLDAAEARMIESGYHGMSLRQISRDVGVSATSVYLHFSSKEDLAIGVCQRRFAALADLIADACAEGDDVLTQLRACGQVYARFGLDNPELYGYMFGEGLSYDEIVAHVGNEDELVGNQILHFASALLAQGMDAGLIRRTDPDALATALWAGLHGVIGIIEHMGAKPTTPSPDALVETMLDVLIAGLAAGPTAA